MVQKTSFVAMGECAPSRQGSGVTRNGAPASYYPRVLEVSEPAAVRLRGIRAKQELQFDRVSQKEKRAQFAIRVSPRIRVFGIILINNFRAARAHE
jgi:hypothetical protein